MTKFVLHGGSVGDENEDNFGFFKEMTQIDKGQVNFLICCFACDKDRVEDKFRRHSDLFEKYSDGKVIDFYLADENIFEKQLGLADVLFLEGGGSTEQLVEKLSKFGKFSSLIEGKIVGGTSAGANCLAKYFFGNMSQKVGKGLGVLNIKTYCHFPESDNKNVSKLANYKEILPLILLPDYKWMVVNN